MIICFNATAEAKHALDAMLETRQFRDTSEAISLALTNYQVIHKAFQQSGRVTLNEADLAQAVNPVPPPAPISTPKITSENLTSAKPTVGENRIPDLFQLRTTDASGLKLAEVPVADPAATYPPNRWLFGQYNKFLPVKAACRALFNLMRDNPGGVSLNEAVVQIADAACVLGDSLKVLDNRHQLRRDEAFAAAFPSSDKGGEGSRMRFATQFVAAIRKQAQTLDGMPAALRLVALETGKEPRLTLTRKGAEFATLPNPVLDDYATFPSRKFNDAEIALLMEHIRQSVPEEVSAYAAIIEAINNGMDTPEKLDTHLRNHFKLPHEADIAETFLSTQRTGAVSRMVDSGLIARVKAGLRVNYSITQAGQQFQGKTHFSN